MEYHDNWLKKLEAKIERNERSIEQIVDVMGSLSVRVNENAEAIGRLTAVWTDFVETYAARENSRDSQMQELTVQVVRLEGDA